jgi:hypothetical protein
VTTPGDSQFEIRRYFAAARKNQLVAISAAHVPASTNGTPARPTAAKWRADTPMR